MTDWNQWLVRYDKPRSPHSQRLVTVQRLIARRFDRTAPRPISALSICAGDGRDIIQVLADRHDAARITATLVELDPRLCARARAQATEHALSGVGIIEGDAGVTDTYAGLARADLLILVGVFGNIVDTDVKTTIATLPALCGADALVIWSLRQQPRRDQTAHDAELCGALSRRNDSARVDRIRGWFAEQGFEEVFANREDAAFHVGAQRFRGQPAPLPAGRRFFTFDLKQKGDAKGPT
jgi:hypothetical protein